MNWTSSAKQELASYKLTGFEQAIEQFAMNLNFGSITTYVVKSWYAAESKLGFDWGCSCGYVNPQSEQFCQACSYRRQAVLRSLNQMTPFYTYSDAFRWYVDNASGPISFLISHYYSEPRRLWVRSDLFYGYSKQFLVLVVCRVPYGYSPNYQYLVPQIAP